MLDPGFVRENRELVETKLRSRGLHVDLSPFFEAEQNRRSSIREVEEMKRQSNIISKEIGLAVQRGENADARKEEMRKSKERIKELDVQIKIAEARPRDFL